MPNEFAIGTPNIFDKISSAHQGAPLPPGTAATKNPPLGRVRREKMIENLTVDAVSTSVELASVEEEFGDQISVSIDGKEVGRISYQKLKEFCDGLLLGGAPSEIPLTPQKKLSVYQQRGLHALSSSNGLRIDLIDRSILLNRHSANALGQVLMAYSSSKNQDINWLVLEED